MPSNQPIRIQRKRTRGWKMPPNSVYVGRPSKWGNPFRIGDGYPYSHSRPLTRKAAVEVFEQSLKWGHLDISIEDVKRELRGHHLACWCKSGEPCHADVLLEVANA